MIKTESTYYFPNRLARTMLLAFEEVIGKSGINALLNLSSLSQFIDNYPPDDDNRTVPFGMVGRFQSALELGYGSHGGRGLALRTGRVFFSTTLRIYGSELGYNDTNFRLHPPDLKIVAGLNTLIEFLNRHTDQNIALEETEHKYLCFLERCPWCWGRHENEPVCHFVIGMLQEALYWGSGGKFYNVVEETCIAQGDKICLVAIDRVPLT
jgi:predicted hydrocarbon binding protein